MGGRRLARFAVATLCSVAAPILSIASPLPTRVEAAFQPAVQVSHIGDHKSLEVKVFLPASGCAGTPQLDSLSGSLTLKIDGQVDQTNFASLPVYSFNCTDGAFFAHYIFEVFSGFGQHTLTVDYSGNAGAQSATSNAVVLQVLPDYETPTLKAGGANPDPGISGFGCQARQMGAPAGNVSPPAGVSFPAGIVSYNFSGCGYGCGWECPAGSPDFPDQRILLEVPGTPDGATAWVWNSGQGQGAPTWRPLPEPVVQGRVLANITGNTGDRELSGLIAISPAPRPTTALQDIWWGGPSQNGWGVSLAQSGDALFGGFYIYRDNGAPVWAMLSGGTWNAARTQITGDLYAPAGSWFRGYDPARLRVGPAIGTATLSVTSPSSALIDYRIGDQVGQKALQRYAMGADLTPGEWSGMWWGGYRQNGWGLQIQQQGSNFFAVWFTYDSSGLPIWYVMSGGAPSTAGPGVSGTLYATSSSPWLGVYDPSRLSLRAVGSLVLEFDAPDVARMTYTVDGFTATNRIYRFPL